jgi:hypothetical protein
MVREVNSLVMLSKSHECRSELMRKYNYQDDQVLSKDKVAAYLFDNNRIENMEVTQEEGIIATTFDSIIHELNETSDDIFYTYRDHMKEDACDIVG